MLPAPPSPPSTQATTASPSTTSKNPGQLLDMSQHEQLRDGEKQDPSTLAAFKPGSKFCKSGLSAVS